jgi:hypothetical protein
MASSSSRRVAERRSDAFFISPPDYPSSKISPNEIIYIKDTYDCRHIQLYLEKIMRLGTSCEIGCYFWLEQWYRIEAKMVEDFQQ